MNSRNSSGLIRVSVCALGLIAMALLTACQSASAPKPSAPVVKAPTAQQLAQVRKAFPEAQVGTVVSVLPEHGYAAIGDVESASLKVGNIVMFVEPNGAEFNHGQVRGFGRDGHTIHVQYDLSAKRAPVNGDIAVAFPK